LLTYQVKNFQISTCSINWTRFGTTDNYDYMLCWYVIHNVTLNNGTRLKVGSLVVQFLSY